MPPTRLRRFRKSQSLTLEALARRVGLNIVALHRIEPGKTSLTKRMRMRLEHGLENRAKYLLADLRRKESAGSRRPHSKPTRLETYRSRQGWTIRTMARKVGLPAATLFRIESRTTSLTRRMRHRLAQFLGRKAAYLLADLKVRRIGRLGAFCAGRGITLRQLARAMRISVASAHRIESGKYTVTKKVVTR